MAGWTNRGKLRMLDYFLRRYTPLPTAFYFALCTDAVSPTADTNTLGELIEVAVGNGYDAGGRIRLANADNFVWFGEDDVNDWASVLSGPFGWNAVGGPIPASGPGARYLVMTDNNATLADREVYCFWDLIEPRTVSNGQMLNMLDVEFRAVEV